MTSKQNKNPNVAEKSNAEKWVLYLSAFDFSALRRPLCASECTVGLFCWFLERFSGFHNNSVNCLENTSKNIQS
jgi:hypothetical protein